MYPVYYFFLTVFRLRPPAIDVAAGAPFAARVLRLSGVTVPLPGASETVPDTLSLSSLSS